MPSETELLAEGEALLTRRQELERTIARDFRGTPAALAVQIAQVERLRGRVRHELRRLVEDEPLDEDDEREASDSDEEPPESFYEARERLAARDRELVDAIAGLQQRRRAAGATRSPPPLADLEHQRHQLEAAIRQWRGRCRQAGLAASLPRFDEYDLGGSAED